MADGNGNGRNGTVGMVTPLVAAVSLVASVAGMFWTNSKGDVNAVKYELREDLNRTEERLMKEIAILRDIVQQKGVYQAEYQEFKTRTDKATEILNSDLRALRGDLVSRSEHQQHWSEFSNRMDNIRDSLNEERKQRASEIADIHKEVGGTYTLGDVVKQLQDQIKQLNSRLDQLKVNNNQVQPSPTRSGLPPAIYRPMTITY